MKNCFFILFLSFSLPMVGQEVALVSHLMPIIQKETKNNQPINRISNINPKPDKIKGLESVNRSNFSIASNFGLVGTHYIGQPAEYLGLGGGGSVDIVLSFKYDIMLAFSGDLFTSRVKKEYSLISQKEQESPQSTLMSGLKVGKGFKHFNILAEINFASRSVILREGEFDNDFVFLRGWCPGVSFQYPIRIGKEKFHLGSFGPVLQSHAINFDFSLKYINFDLREASGLMVELGVSYTSSQQKVKDYVLE